MLTNVGYSISVLLGCLQEIVVKEGKEKIASIEGGMPIVKKFTIVPYENSLNKTYVHIEHLCNG